MKIGLIDIEPKIVNTAYMQISQYHKQRGDVVEWWSPLEDRQFDHVYCSSLFDFTDKREVPKRAITGGTGYDISSRLSQAIESCNYDYTLYPKCDYSIVWFSRGCIRKCPFCCVWQKEGKIRSVEPKPLNSNGKYIVVQDNNFFANKEWKKNIDQLHEWGLPIEFNSGIDLRIITYEQIQSFSGFKFCGGCQSTWVKKDQRGKIVSKRIKCAWDNPEDDLRPQIKMIVDAIPAYKLLCYVLIGFNSTPEQDLYRVETLRSFNIDPFVMPYNKKDPYQKRFARWVNMKAIFKSVKWEDYE